MSRPAPVRDPNPGWGLLLAAPALLLWLFGLVPPVLSTLYLSLTRTGGISGRGTFVGAANYGQLFDDGVYGRAAGFTVLVVVVRVVAVAVVPPLLAWGTVVLGRRVAIPLAVVFAVPLAFATPAFAAVANQMGAAPGALASTGGARATVLGTDGTYALLYACGIGLVVLTAALRAETRPGRTGLLGRPFVTAWAVGLLAAAAYGLQAFTGVGVMTGGGPAHATDTLGSHALAVGFQESRFGYSAAVEMTFLLPVLLLGLCAGALVIAGRTALDPRPDPVGRRPVRNPAAWVAGGVALLVALVVWGRGLWPIAAGWSGRPVQGVSVGGAVFRVLLHDLPSTLLVVVVALAAAFGIVVFRPLGRGGLWLLLPFAPWLFLTTVAQAPALYLAYAHGTVQRPFAHLQPALGLLPILLFAFVILLRGLEPRWRAARARREPLAFARHVLAPGWLAALGVSAGAFLAVTHEYVTAWITVPDPQDQPLPLAVVRAGQTLFAYRGTAVTRPDLPLAVITFAMIAVGAAWLAGRAVLRDGTAEPR
jgi:ABC-type sugar transport system permease subunit